jgi:hypothetical protein
LLTARSPLHRLVVVMLHLCLSFPSCSERGVSTGGVSVCLRDRGRRESLSACMSVMTMPLGALLGGIIHSPPHEASRLGRRGPLLFLPTPYSLHNVALVAWVLANALSPCHFGCRWWLLIVADILSLWFYSNGCLAGAYFLAEALPPWLCCLVGALPLLQAWRML